MHRKYQRTVSTSSWRSASRPGGLIITPKWGTWQHTWEVGEPFTTPKFFRTKWYICPNTSCLNTYIYIYRHSLSLMIIVNMKYNIHISMCMYIYIICVRVWNWYKQEAFPAFLPRLFALQRCFRMKPWPGGKRWNSSTAISVFPFGDPKWGSPRIPRKWDWYIYLGNDGDLNGNDGDPKIFVSNCLNVIFFIVLSPSEMMNSFWIQKEDTTCNKRLWGNTL